MGNVGELACCVAPRDQEDTPADRRLSSATPCTNNHEDVDIGKRAIDENKVDTRNLATVGIAALTPISAAVWLAMAGVIHIVVSDLFPSLPLRAVVPAVVVLLPVFVLFLPHNDLPTAASCQSSFEADGFDDEDKLLTLLQKRWSERVGDLVRRQPRPAKKPSSYTNYDGSLAERIDWNVEGTEAYASVLRDVSRSDLRRYLVARNRNVEHALQLAENVALWRAAVRPWELKPSLMWTPLQQGFVRFGGHTKCGYPIIVTLARLWRPSKYKNVDEYIRLLAYWVYFIRKSRSGPGVNRVIVICELDGFSIEMARPCAVQCIANLAKIVQDVNAERIAGIYMLNANLVFRSSYHLFSAFLDSNTRRKVHWPKASEMRSVLGRIIDISSPNSPFGSDRIGPCPALVGEWEQDTALPPPPPYDSTVADPLRDVSL
eukprot:TRINITY_DN15462_c0_g1_i1.p1 TRINITY_DN15462_c0_g1~~TRINITY_DN15462_c0_g1_i1.p1  ORF type:complete len:432 (+),score=51.20 TRINITY_DN15462_c0_g1_i1:67-1362(+)